jgi:putative membrane protein
MAESGRDQVSGPSEDERNHDAPTHGEPPRPAGLLGIYLRGIAMGTADIVPGVSGGTMALILGIYERLILALRSLARPPFLQALARGRVELAAKQVDGAFLLALFAGILTAVLSLAHLLSSLLESRPAFVYAFFFGLIVASVLLVGRRIGNRTAPRWALFLAGAGAAWWLVGLTPAQTPDAAWFLFLSGALAVSALLLPGISGAFVLVLLGKYSYVLEALSNGDIVALGAVGAGLVFGVLTFSQVLGWLFRRFHDATLALLSGVMFGSLRKVWPWQAVSEGLTVNHPPPADIWSSEQGPAWALLLALAGAAVVLLLDWAGARSEQSSPGREFGEA